MGAPLAEDLADPDMCVHLWPGMGPRAGEDFGDGLAADGLAGVDVAAVDDVRAAVVDEVEALAMLSPNARVAPSTAAPAAVPMSGLVILTRFSFHWCSAGQRRGRAGGPLFRRAAARAGRGTRAPRGKLVRRAGVIPCSAGRWPGTGRVARQVPVRQPDLTGLCALLLSGR